MTLSVEALSGLAMDTPRYRSHEAGMGITSSRKVLLAPLFYWTFKRFRNLLGRFWTLFLEVFLRSILPLFLPF
jgi:hypothetical protein